MLELLNNFVKYSKYEPYIRWKLGDELKKPFWSREDAIAFIVEKPEGWLKQNELTPAFLHVSKIDEYFYEMTLRFYLDFIYEVLFEMDHGGLEQRCLVSLNSDGEAPPSEWIKVAIENGYTPTTKVKELLKKQGIDIKKVKLRKKSIDKQTQALLDEYRGFISSNSDDSKKAVKFFVRYLEILDVLQVHPDDTYTYNFIDSKGNRNSKKYTVGSFANAITNIKKIILLESI